MRTWITNELTGIGACAHVRTHAHFSSCCGRNSKSRSGLGIIDNWKSKLKTYWSKQTLCIFNTLKDLFVKLYFFTSLFIIFIQSYSQVFKVILDFVVLGYEYILVFLKSNQSVDFDGYIKVHWKYSRFLIFLIHWHNKYFLECLDKELLCFLCFLLVLILFKTQF